jgi:Predicted metalloendopeptidase
MNKLIKIFLILTFVCLSAELQAQSGDYFLKENMDVSVKPTDDFFNYANGTFVKNHPMPSYEAVYGIFNVVTDSVYEYLRQICEESLKDTKAVKGSNVQKIRDFYFSGLDSAGMEKDKLTPLKGRLESIEKVSDKKSLAHLIAMMQTNYIQPLFSPYVTQDLMQSDKYALYIYQGGLGLPEREYYFRNDERTANIRKEYVSHVRKMLEFAGYSARMQKNIRRKL